MQSANIQVPWKRARAMRDWLALPAPNNSSSRLLRTWNRGDSLPPPIYGVNLGNAALQAEHVGTAIAAYRRALHLDPGHSRANQNLAFARGTLPDWAQSASTNDLVETLFFWRRLYSAYQIATLSAAAFLLAAVLVGIGIALRSPAWRNLGLLPLVVWGILGISLWWPVQGTTGDAVVSAQSATLRSADSENSPPRISDPLPDGTELSVLQHRDRWTEVQLGNRSGWVRSSQLTLVTP